MTEPRPTHAAPAGRDARAQAQRKRILAAAQACFTERGFHGASMAMIADTAQMSAGLIYRYFSGKSEIIRGIVEQQLEMMAAEMARPDHASTPMAERLFENYYRGGGPDSGQPWLDAGLVMEISAEAARDPIIGAAMRSFDATVQARIEDWLRKPVASGGLGIAETEVPARALMLRLVIDGLKMRQPRQPDLDPALLRRCLAGMLQPLLDPDGIA